MQLVIQTGPDTGKVFMIDRPLLVIGRQAGCEILLGDPQISRRHLQIESRNGQDYVTDLGSANGSSLNGQQLIPNQPQPIKPGDLIRFGTTSIAVQMQPVPVQPNYPVQPNPYPAQPPQQYQPQQFQPSQPQPQYQPQPQQQYQPQAYPAQPIYPANPAAQVQKPKSKVSGPLIGGIALVLIVLAGIIGLVISNAGQSTKSSTATSNNAAITAPAETVVALPTATVPRGQSGTNPPPPPPAVSGTEVEKSSFAAPSVASGSE